MAERGKISLALIFGIFLVGFITASVNCTPSSLSTSFDKASPVQLTTQCINSGNDSVNLTPAGDFDLSSNIIGGGATKTFTLTFHSSISEGVHSGLIIFNDASTSVPVSYTITSQVITPSCSINIFPSTLTNIKISQGETKTRTVTLSVPTCFTSPVIVQGISLQTDQKPIQLGELSAGTLQPGQSLNIPIILDGTGIALGQYNDVLQILLYNSSGNTIPVSNANIGVLVSQGVNPLSNFSMADLPTCSLNSVELNLNGSYNFVCSISNPNIKIQPVINSFYILGISDTSTSTQYIYNFKAKRIGVTSFAAKFYYEGSNGLSEIGEPFNQSVRISNTGNSPISGISLDLVFYQGGVKKTKNNLSSGEAVIQAVDNESRNLIEGAVMFIGGIEIPNKTIIIDAYKDYEIRVTAPGFNNLETTFKATDVQLPFIIFPVKDVYDMGDIINLSSSVSNVTYSIEGVAIQSPYTLNSLGNFVITASNPNYKDTQMNVSVVSGIYIVSSLPETSEWKNRKDVKIALNSISKWEVDYRENGSSENKLLTSGEGDMIAFKIKGAGTYEIKADGITLQSVSVAKTKYPAWQIGLAAFGVLFIIFIISRIGKKKKGDDIEEIIGAG